MNNAYADLVRAGEGTVFVVDSVEEAADGSAGAHRRVLPPVARGERVGRRSTAATGRRVRERDSPVPRRATEVAASSGRLRRERAVELELRIGGRRMEAVELPGDREGAPARLLHEGLGSVSAWRTSRRRSTRATSRRVVIFSRFGHGKSDPPPAPRTPAFFHEEADRVLPEVLRQVSAGEPVLVGHSDGASIALIHAGAHPVSGLVLIAPHVVVEQVTLEAIRETRERFETGDLRERLSRHHDDPEAAFRGWCDVWLDPAFRDVVAGGGRRAGRVPGPADPGSGRSRTARSTSSTGSRRTGSRARASGCRPGRPQPSRESPEHVLRELDAVPRRRWTSTRNGRPPELAAAVPAARRAAGPVDQPVSRDENGRHKPLAKGGGP